MALGAFVRDHGCRARNLLKRGGEPERIAADLAAHLVGLVFAAPAYRHLDDHGRKGRQDHHGDLHDRMRPVVAASAEQEAELRQRRDGAGERRGDRHDERVAILDVRKLMGHHACQFLAAQKTDDARGGGDCRILRVAPRREGVGLVLIDQIDARGRQARIGGELVHHSDQFGRFLVGQFAGVVGGKRHPVRVPPGDDIADAGHAECHQHAGLATDHQADCAEQGRHAAKQDRRAPVIHAIASIGPIRRRTGATREGLCAFARSPYVGVKRCLSQVVRRAGARCMTANGAP
jgi:hypothetical protein